MLLPSAAITKAEKLIGQWPHARPPNPHEWIASLAAILAEYPEGLVDECIDPRRGLARKREFPPTVVVLSDWLDERMNYYKLMAEYQPRQEPTPKPHITDQERAIASHALRKLFNWLKGEPSSRGEPPTWAEAERDLGSEKPA